MSQESHGVVILIDCPAIGTSVLFHGTRDRSDARVVLEKASYTIKRPEKRPGGEMSAAGEGSTHASYDHGHGLG